jgi:hypothetical protein
MTIVELQKVLEEQQKLRTLVERLDRSHLINAATE